MSSTPHQQNRIVHRNQADTSRILNKHTEFFNSIKTNTLNTKTSIDAINTKTDTLSGAPNNNLSMEAVKYQMFPYAHDTVTDIMRPLKCDASGRLECSIDALEITADTINLSTNELETKIQTTNDKLDGFSGAPDNNLSTGSTKLQVFPYGKDSVNDIMRPIKVDDIGKQIIDSPAAGDICTRLEAIKVGVQHSSIDVAQTQLIAGGTTHTFAAVDTASDNNGLYKFQLAGTVGHTNFDFELQVSQDGVTYYSYPHVLFTITNSTVFTHFDLAFRHHRIRATNNTASDYTVTYIESGRH